MNSQIFQSIKRVRIHQTNALKKDVFVHVTQLEDSMKVGDKGKFEVEQVPQGFEVRNMAIANA